MKEKQGGSGRQKGNGIADILTHEAEAAASRSLTPGGGSLPKYRSVREREI